MLNCKICNWKFDFIQSQTLQLNSSMAQSVFGKRMKTSKYLKITCSKYTSSSVKHSCEWDPLWPSPSSTFSSFTSFSRSPSDGRVWRTGRWRRSIFPRSRPRCPPRRCPRGTSAPPAPPRPAPPATPAATQVWTELKLLFWQPSRVDIKHIKHCPFVEY